MNAKVDMLGVINLYLSYPIGQYLTFFDVYFMVMSEPMLTIHTAS